MRKKIKILPYIVLGIVTIGILNQSKKKKKHVIQNSPIRNANQDEIKKSTF